MLNIEKKIRTLLTAIGPGHLSNSAYDTAWVARMGAIDADLSNQALEWICTHQLPDGSWGSKDIYYYHDRVICTLAAMIALTHRGRRAPDKRQIEKGLIALEAITSGATNGLALDPNGATVGFEMIVPTLIAEAEKLGIIKQQGERILGKMKHLRNLKMQRLAGLRINREYTPAFSVEMAGDDKQNIIDIDNLQESNGSVANSPSATAYFAHRLKVGDEKALNYLRTTIRHRNGGVPFASPSNILERAWSLWNLSLIPSFLEDTNIREDITTHVKFLDQAWRNDHGVGFSDEYTPCDSDDTSVTFYVLARFNNTKNLKTIFDYEDKEHFRCYPLEAHPSIGANVHILGVLKQAGLEKKHPAIEKILSYLRKTCQREGFWIDKWHISPYYTTAHVAITCKDLDNDLCEKALNWIMNTQKPNGAWGSFLPSTAEETAYALQALKTQNNIIYQRHIDKGAKWLETHYHDPRPDLWIGKVLFCPQYIVEATILSALALCRG